MRIWSTGRGWSSPVATILARRLACLRRGREAGATLDECDNLDIAPTLLTLLGLPVRRR